MALPASLPIDDIIDTFFSPSFFLKLFYKINPRIARPLPLATCHYSTSIAVFDRMCSWSGSCVHQPLSFALQRMKTKPFMRTYFLPNQSTIFNNYKKKIPALFGRCYYNIFKASFWIKIIIHFSILIDHILIAPCLPPRTPTSGSCFSPKGFSRPTSRGRLPGKCPQNQSTVMRLWHDLQSRLCRIRPAWESFCPDWRTFESNYFDSSRTL